MIHKRTIFFPQRPESWCKATWVAFGCQSASCAPAEEHRLHLLLLQSSGGSIVRMHRQMYFVRAGLPRTHGVKGWFCELNQFAA